MHALRRDAARARQGFRQEQHAVEQGQGSQRGQGQHHGAPAIVRIEQAAHGGRQHGRQADDGHQQGKQLRRFDPIGHVAHHAHHDDQGQRRAQALQGTRQQQGAQLIRLRRPHGRRDVDGDAGQERMAPAQHVGERPAQQLPAAQGQQEDRQAQLHVRIRGVQLARHGRHRGQVHVDTRRTKHGHESQGSRQPETGGGNSGLLLHCDSFYRQKNGAWTPPCFLLYTCCLPVGSLFNQ
ncbi:hypothetical protein D3C72_1497400 [compost metagenome]